MEVNDEMDGGVAVKESRANPVFIFKELGMPAQNCSFFFPFLKGSLSEHLASPSAVILRVQKSFDCFQLWGTSDSILSSGHGWWCGSPRQSAFEWPVVDAIRVWRIWPNHPLIALWGNMHCGISEPVSAKELEIVASEERKAAPRESFRGTLREWDLEKGWILVHSAPLFMARKGTSYLTGK